MLEKALARPNQELWLHLTGVGSSTAGLCSYLKAWAKLIGLLHDYGKYRPEWVKGMHEIAQGKKVKLPPHAIEGALYLMRLFPNREHVKTLALALAIACHHSGLPDLEVGIDRLKGIDRAKPLPDFKDDTWNIDPEYLDELQKAIATVDYRDLDAWLIFNDYRTAQRLRFLYGCLIAADRQNAAESDGWKPRVHPSMAELAANLAVWYADKYNSPKKDIDRLRCDFYAKCRKGAQLDPGWLSVIGPCGISKTWSVMQMALDHAAKWNKKTVIYCVPWTAILDQSYNEYQTQLGEGNVTGHWSTLVDPDTQDPKLLRNSRQWWDTPIVATTMVQLFDVLLGASARTAQRMPSLQDAVIILDEVQGLPYELLITCIKILDQLVTDFGVTIVLSTATMPDYRLLDINPTSVIPAHELDRYFKETKRVDYQWVDRLSWQQIATRITQEQLPSTLIVTNTVAACDDAYQTMKQLDGYRIFKYTASMPPAHREVILAEIKSAVKAAKDNKGPKVVICATSAIETGVDLDCSIGYCEVSGIESIAQFAGRINRNMGNQVSPVIIFETEAKYALPPGMKKKIEYAKKAIALGTDLQSPDVLKFYSTLLLQDVKRSQSDNSLTHLCDLKFETVSNNWQMISPTTSILIDPRKWGAADNIIAEFDRAIADANFRILQRHCVGLYKGKYNKAKEQQCIANSDVKDLEQWIGSYDLGIGIDIFEDSANQ